MELGRCAEAVSRGVVAGPVEQRSCSARPCGVPCDALRGERPGTWGRAIGRMVADMDRQVDAFDSADCEQCECLYRSCKR